MKRSFFMIRLVLIGLMPTSVSSLLTAPVVANQRRSIDHRQLPSGTLLVQALPSGNQQDDNNSAGVELLELIPQEKPKLYPKQPQDATDLKKPNASEIIISIHQQQEAEMSPKDKNSNENNNSSNNNNGKNRGRLLLIGAAALYGTNFSIVRLLGQTDMTIALSATLRFGLAALATSPWLFAPSNNNNNNNNINSQASREATWRGLEVGGWNAIGYIAQAIGLQTTLASKSAFLCSLAVVVVPLLDWATGKQLAAKQAAGVLLALVGVAVLELGGLSASDLALSSGDLASMVQPLAFGVAFWRMEQAMHKYPEEAKRATAGQLLAVFVASAAYGAVSSPEAFQVAPILHDLSQPTILASLIWTGCVTTALTIYMESMALKSLSAAETTLILSTEPLWGTAFAAVVLGEQVGVDTAIGAVLIIAACLVSNLGLEGMKNLVWNGQNKQKTKDEDDDDEDNDIGDVSRTGFMAAAGSSFLGAFKELDVTLRLTADQILDFLGSIFPSGPPNS